MPQENSIEAAVYCGYLRQPSKTSAFLCPAFYAKNDIFVQSTDTNNCIAKFVKISDAEKTSLVMDFSGLRPVKVGEGLVYVIELEKQDIRCGHLQYLSNIIAPYFQIFYRYIEEKPFTTLSIARVVNNINLEEQALICCVRHLVKNNYSSAREWLNNNYTSNTRTPVLDTLIALLSDDDQEIDIKLKQLFLESLESKKLPKDNLFFLESEIPFTTAIAFSSLNQLVGKINNNGAEAESNLAIYEKQTQTEQDKPDKKLHKLGLLADLRYKRGEYQKAITLLESALNSFIDDNTLEHDVLSVPFRMILAAYYHEIGDTKKSILLLEENLSILENAETDESIKLIHLYRSLASANRRGANYTEAKYYAEKGVELTRTILGPEHEEYAGLLVTLGLTHSGPSADEEQLTTAENQYKEAIGVLKALPQYDRRLISRALSGLSSVHVKQNKYNNAYAEILEAKAITEKIGGKNSYEMAIQLMNLAIVEEVLKRPVLANRNYRKSIKIMEKARGENNQFLVAPIRALAEFHQRRREMKKEMNLADRGLAIAQLHGLNNYDTQVLINMRDSLLGQPGLK